MTKTEIKKLGFAHVANIILAGERLSFHPNTCEIEGTGWVYVWVQVNTNRKDVFVPCYVGKAGKTLKKRWREHIGGFNRNHGTGRTLADRARGYLDDSLGNKIHIYARQSPLCTVFDQDVSLSDVEEHAIYRKIGGRMAGLWNRTEL